MPDFQVTITEKGGKPSSQTFSQSEVTIGRVPGNDIVLPKGNISKRHSRIVLRDGRFIIVDLKSTNGTYVNGKRINSPQVLHRVDKVYIGDFTIQVDGQGDEPQKAPAPPEPEEDVAIDDDSEDLFDALDGDMMSEAEALLKDSSEDAAPPTPAPEPRKEAPAPPAPRASRRPRRANGGAPPAMEVPASTIEDRKRVFEAVKNAVADARGADMKKAAEKAVGAAIDKLGSRGKAPAGANLDAWRREIVDEVTGLGAVGPLLDDPGVTEIFVNGPYQVYVRRDAEEPRPEPAMFSSPEALSAVIARMLRGTGLAFDDDHPVVEARLADGTRIHAVHPSCARSGPVLTLTRRSQSAMSLDDLVGEGVLTAGMAEFLSTCVRTRRNVLIAGSPGADLGTFVGAVAGAAPDGERVVCVEQAGDLPLQAAHLVRLEARAPSRMREAVAAAVRMCPDRLVVHELGGAESLDVLIAMGGGQDGAIASSYAGSAQEALSRLGTMMTLGDDIPARIARKQIADALDVVVVLTRYGDGNERVSEVVEVTGADVDLVTTQAIFTYKKDRDSFSAKGEPRFYQELKRRGEQVDASIFRDGA